MEKKVLEDHFKTGKKLIPPFTKDFNFNPISWETDTIPEIIWIAFVHEALGRDNGTEFLVEIWRHVALDQAAFQAYSMAMISNYDLLNEADKNATLTALTKNGLLVPLQACIKTFIEIYPASPLNFLLPDFNPDIHKPAETHVSKLKKILKELYDKNSETAVFTATNAIYNQLINGTMHITAESSLAHLPEIHHYPNTELSLKIAGAVRASIKSLQFPFCYNAQSNWRNYFWKTTYNLDPYKM